MYKMKAPDRTSPTPKREEWPDEETMNRIDVEIARRAIEEIEKDPSRLISGKELEKRLARLRKG